MTKIDPADILLGNDGHLYVDTRSLPLASRAGRRVVRAVALTPGEEVELRRRIHEIGIELVGALPEKKKPRARKARVR